MGGKGSGRKPLVNERVMENLLTCSAEYLLAVMTNPAETHENKLRIALTLGSKYTPSSQTIEHEGIAPEVKQYTLIHNYDNRSQNIPEQQAESRLDDTPKA